MICKEEGIVEGIEQSTARQAMFDNKTEYNSSLKDDQVIELTYYAHKSLIRYLENFGNRLTSTHSDALRVILHLYSQLAFGLTSGRFAVPLGTGLGKTASIIAWVSAINDLGYDQISLAVCASQVEALCDLKRGLIRSGVPESKIGLWHTYSYNQQWAHDYIEGRRQDLPKGHASEPPTDPAERQSKQILLVTHSRVRGKGSAEAYNTFNDKPRSLVIWDESLFVSDCFGLEKWELEAARDWLKRYPRHDPRLVAFLDECLEAFQGELDRQKDDGREAEPVMIERHTAEDLDAFERSLPSKEAVNPIRQFLEIAHHQLRVFQSKGTGGVITYSLVVDSSLENMVVLDASYPIRDLCKLNKDITLLGCQNHELVSYERVRINQLPFHSGRHSLERYLGQLSRSDAGVLKELIEVIRLTPKDEAILVFTFKTREKRDFISALKKAMQTVGIDPEETIMVNEQGREVMKPRICFLHWGCETSINKYSYCSTVVFAGVLHRSRLDLASYVVGQLDDINAEINSKELQRIENSEICHCLYQAMSRGSCRIIENGYARPMTVWLIHKYGNIRPIINEVMPSVQWSDWKPVFVVSKTKVKLLTDKVMHFLKDLPNDITAISIKKIKRGLEIPSSLNRTFSRALRKAVVDGWVMHGRSLIRVPSLFS